MIKKWLNILFFSIFFILIFKIAYAQIVIFPFEDLSKGDHGINFEIPEEIAQKLSEEGFKVISPKKVIPLLIKFRKVNFYQINFTLLREIYKNFNAEYVLLGNIGKLQKEPPAISIVVKLVDVLTGKITWGKSVSFSAEDFISFLGLKKIDYFSMMEKVYKALLTDFKEPFKSISKITPTVDIQEVVFNSRYVQPGKTVECIVKMVFSGPKPSFIGVEVKDNKRKRLIPLNKYTNDRSYIAFWKAPEKEGRYSVVLVVTWDDKWKITKRIFIGRYYVDNTPPNLNLVIRGAKKKKGKVLVKDVLEIIPKVVGNNNSKFIGRGNGIAKWQIEIYSKNKNTLILKESYPGKLPAFLTWYTKGGINTLSPGDYLIKFKVWDLAGNQNEVEKEVLLITDPPTPEVIVYDGKEKDLMEIEINKNFISLVRVYLEIFNKDGEKIAEIKKEGEPFDKIKKEIIFDKEKIKNLDNLYYNAIIEDELRNKKILRRTSVIVKKAEEGPIKPTFKTWVDEF
ncbi:hypothetical protein DRN73_06730 [Candidatus Pacearchaeota archaeon]|nr:MAG: hypothetical protein DRN73_06730 [Candidatus Pacearchaeota archaeon]